jgi:hypothetical protein
MWLIFGQPLPRLILGMLYVVPIAFIESILLFGLFSRLERNLAPADHGHSNSRIASSQRE